MASAMVGGCAGDGVEQAEHPVGFVADGEQVEGELEERRARHAVAVGSAGFDHADGDEVFQAARRQVGEEAGDLIGRRGGAGFVDVDHLVGGEAEDVAQVAAVGPGGEQVADAGQGVAATLEPADQLEATEVAEAVDADPPSTRRRRQHPHGLVLPDRPHRDVGSPCQVIDRQLVDQGVVCVFSHS